MRNAEIAQEGTPHDLYEQPVDVFVADFVGDANLVKCEIANLDGMDAIVRLGDLDLRLPHRDLPAGEADLAIRPEAIRLNAGQAGVGKAMAGKVRKAVYLGSHVEYMVETAIGELFVIDPRADHATVAGSDVIVTFAERGVVLVRP
jgi:iron(III) transport system ATP-binding protein